MPNEHDEEMLERYLAAMPDLPPGSHALPIWGVVRRTKYRNNPSVFQQERIEVLEVVANAKYFHPKAVIVDNLTHDEATAIMRIHNLGEQHGSQ